MAQQHRYHRNFHDDWMGIRSLAYRRPQDYSVDDVERLAHIEIARNIYSNAALRDYESEQVTEADASGYRPPTTYFMMRFLVNKTHWNSSSYGGVKDALLNHIESAFQRKRTETRASFHTKGTRRFPITSRFVVPLETALEMTDAQVWHKLVMPPQLPAGLKRKLRAAGIRPVVGWHDGEWVLHLNNEDQYVFARMLV
jgi:FAD/FMN-containing dehydrogenase